MNKGQVSIRDGVEDVLFPMEYCNITQGDLVGTHAGTYAVDLAGKDTGRDFAYFPFSAKSVALDSTKNGNAVIWESLNKVRFANGLIDYCCMMVIHDNDATGFAVGSSYAQGTQMAQEGTAGYAIGNHLHIEVARGRYSGGTYGMYDRNAQGVYHLRNNMPIEDVCFMDQTVILNGKGNWRYIGSDINNKSYTKQKLYLPATATKWNVYPITKQPVIGNEVGFLNPALFSGLEYDIIDKPYQDVVTIQTRDYGKVNIYVASSTGAIIK